MNETYDKSCNLNRNFEDNLKNWDNSLNSISSIYPDRQFDVISFSTLHELGKSNPSRAIIEHININFIRNKFEPLKKMIKDNIDILLVSETKLMTHFQ